MENCCNTFRYTFTVSRSDAEVQANIAKGTQELESAKEAAGPPCEKEPEYVHWMKVEANEVHLHYGPAPQAK